jgi:hypothetical protein
MGIPTYGEVPPYLRPGRNVCCGAERRGSFQEAVGDAAVLEKGREKETAREGSVASE